MSGEAVWCGLTCGNQCSGYKLECQAFQKILQLLKSGFRNLHNPSKRELASAAGQAPNLTTRTGLFQLLAQIQLLELSSAFPTNLMPRATYTLGELEHVCDRQNLKLTSSGSIKISSPQAFEFPFSVDFRDLETLVSSKVWVAGGNQLQIELHISFDDIEISGHENFDVTEELGIVLCNAEVSRCWTAALIGE